MAKLMEINAGNMIALQFRRRLYQYIRFRYAPVGVVQLKNRDTKRLVDSCFRVKTVPVVDEDGNSTDMTEKSWTKWDETDDPVEKELREWLQIVPWQWQIRANATHFVRKLYDMLSWMEAFVKNNPTTKGTRLYSLLPVSTTYQAAYVKINGTTLHEIFNHTPDQPKMEEFLEEKLNIVRIRKKTSDLQRPFTKKTFQTHRSEILRTVFDVEQFETENRKFVNEIKTNGDVQKEAEEE
ncbi:Hypothetical protein PHPALM_4242 [Phytophthora palmivora]|uniref:Uncharacterized protein n=1 Tax=Phytophthora palmivora TaxID=4796 RepID=A0A2P4YKA5_9STRA|nr:Hypothetical protein PHPALM_4242 [Phytophthora palmivora]